MAETGGSVQKSWLSNTRLGVQTTTLMQVWVYVDEEGGSSPQMKGCIRMLGMCVIYTSKVENQGNGKGPKSESAEGCIFKNGIPFLRLALPRGSFLTLRDDSAIKWLINFKHLKFWLSLSQ